jgi:MinD-like ATPase involved in chromosome partitioning or flagellar assembly
MLELPSYGVVPFDDEVRRSFMQEKPVPFIIRKPNCPAAVAIRKTAAKLSGGKEIASDSAAVQTPATKPKGESFFAKLFAIFRRK